MRICELAKELGIKSAGIIAELKKHGISGKTASSSIDEKMIAVFRKQYAGGTASARKEKPAKKSA